MNRMEVKNLLKMRDMLLESYEKSNNESNKNDSSYIMHNICKNTRNAISAVLLDIDNQLLDYVKESSVGEWLLKIKGITPDLAAGVLAYFNIKNKECAAQFIKYSGADNYNNPHNSNVREIMNKIINNFKSEPASLYGRLSDDKFVESIMQEDSTIETARIKSDRYIRKVFISHIFEEMYREEHDGQLPDRYYNDRDCIIIEPEVPYTR